MYSKDVIEHFSNPRNVGEIEGADGIGQVGNQRCGDLMWMYIKVSNGSGKKVIEDIKFKTLGCAAAIATSSKATELVKGKDIVEALKLTNIDVAAALGGLPPMKMHCSNLAADAIKEAIYNYLISSSMEISDELETAHQRIQKNNLNPDECHT